jgi:hypothetical protein
MARHKGVQPRFRSGQGAATAGRANGQDWRFCASTLSIIAICFSLWRAVRRKEVMMINTVRHKISVVVDLDRCPQRKHHRLSDLNEKRAEAFLHLPGDVETGFDRRKSAVKTAAAFAAWACQASSSVCRIGEGRAPLPPPRVALLLC